MWGAKADLGNWSETIEHGEPVRTINWTTVWANEKGVRQSEFYAAANAGLKPELMIEVWSAEYVGHEKVRFPSTNGTVYTVVRTYKRGEVTELICTAQVGALNG